MAKWEKRADSLLLFSKAPCQCNVPAGTHTMSPSDSSITEGEDDPSGTGFIMALFPSLLISILSTMTTIPLPLMATSVWSVA
jgi:hypothetical protein